ncbi:hypothetical protein DSO57_1037501 [Entomophthora muscae]|uniref:Uncharacterized protein n=1 Tax=Entomophthora muscae TaxID=34485 RepID=A0ACC2TXA4_9FUNG|nr:hypothetical protein DSO57_1037501 [Entomophthora muscae]
MEMNASEDQRQEHHIETAIPNPQFIPTSPSYFNQPPTKHTHSQSVSPNLLTKHKFDFEGENNNPLEPTTWDLKYTLDWLNEYELENFVDLFKSKNIHGESFASLNHKKLRSLGIQSYKERSKLLRTLRSCFPQLETLTIQTDIGKIYSNSNLFPPNFQPTSNPPSRFPAYLESPLRSPPQLTESKVSLDNVKLNNKNLPATSPTSPELPLDDISIQMEEKFPDPLDVEAPIDIDIELEEEFADPLSPAPPFIPDHPFIEETFSDPLAVEAPFITDDFFVEESFSDPLGVLAPEIIPEFDFDISFSDPLDTEPPPVVSPTHKDALIEFQDQILPLQSNPQFIILGQKKYCLL